MDGERDGGVSDGLIRITGPGRPAIKTFRNLDSAVSEILYISSLDHSLDISLRFHE